MSELSDIELHLIGTLATETRFLVQERFPGMPTCIMSTAICRDVLAYFDVPGEPRSVFVLAGNAGWRRWVEETGWPPQGDMPEEAWSVGVNPFAEAAPGRWNGHLVLEVGGGYLDADLGYWARPGRGILLPQGAYFVNGPGVYDAPEGGLVLYRERNPDDRQWSRAKDWMHRGRRKRLVGQLVRRCRVEL